LYANRTSRCRKLRRIADSVVVFDEVQTFEPSLLSPIKEGLLNLVTHSRVSVVPIQTQRGELTSQCCGRRLSK